MKNVLWIIMMMMQILIERRWWRIIFFQENYHCSYLSQRSVNSWMLIRIKKTSTNPSGWVDVFWSVVALWYFSTQGGPWFWHFVDYKLITISKTPCLLLSFSPSSTLCISNKIPWATQDNVIGGQHWEGNLFDRFYTPNHQHTTK